MEQKIPSPVCICGVRKHLLDCPENPRNWVGVASEKPVQEKIIHVNPNCHDSALCEPHGEMGPVMYSEKSVQEIGPTTTGEGPKITLGALRKAVGDIDHLVDGKDPESFFE